MHEVVRKTLQIYLRERRVLGHSDFPQGDLSYLNEKNAVFVTLYFGGKVIASQGRINCKKENTLYECVDLALACLTDPRFSENLKNPDLLEVRHSSRNLHHLPRNHSRLRHIQRR